MREGEPMAVREIKAFHDDELIDLEELTGIAGQSKITPEEQVLVESVARKSNFMSRGDNSKKLRKRSPYIVQKNIKMRTGMAELLADFTVAINSGSDQETLERALLALIRKEGEVNFEKRYMELIRDS